jgi:hypothetical protein
MATGVLVRLEGEGEGRLMQVRAWRAADHSRTDARGQNDGIDLASGDPANLPSLPARYGALV